MIVVAVEYLDVDARVRHPTSQRAELSGFGLVQPLNQHFAFLQHANARGLEGAARGGAIVEEKMRDGSSIHHERAAALDAHASPAQCLAYRGDGAGSVFERDRQILP